MDTTAIVNMVYVCQIEIVNDEPTQSTIDQDAYMPHFWI